MMQRNNTKSDNLESDFAEILEKTRRKRSESGLRRKRMRVPEFDQAILRSSLPLESVVALIAEWISLGQMIKLQELSPLISDILKEWQDKETVDLLGDQVWNEMTE